MPILCYTTKIDSYKTISEIQSSLAKAGVTKIIIDNNINGIPIALTFFSNWNESPVAFTLPCNYHGVKIAMEKNNKVPRSLCNDEQAIRVSWRILKEWVDAQLAIVEARLASINEVFLPYALTKNGETVYHLFQRDTKLLLKENI